MYEHGALLIDASHLSLRKARSEAEQLSDMSLKQFLTSAQYHITAADGQPEIWRKEDRPRRMAEASHRSPGRLRKDSQHRSKVGHQAADQTLRLAYNNAMVSPRDASGPAQHSWQHDI